jgi:hypothetical protein
VVGALAQLVAGSSAHGVDAVGDPVETRAARVVVVAVGATGAAVAVPAGLAQPPSAEQQTGAADQALCLCVGQPVIGAGGIADRGEPAVEHPPHDPRAVGGDVRR